MTTPLTLSILQGGVSWECTFCANNIINKTWRARSPENVLEEIAMLHNPKEKKLLKFWDANFLTNVKRIEKICDLMLENKDFISIFFRIIPFITLVVGKGLASLALNALFSPAHKKQKKYS